MPSLLASDLLASIYNQKNQGYLKCHWCGAPCNPGVIHDDVPNLPFQRSTSTARCPAEHFVCKGCEIYKRKSVTVRFLKEGLKDKQSLQHHSWWMTPEGIWVIREEDHISLYDHLFYPPVKFCLALVKKSEVLNLIQLAVVNDFYEIKADTPLAFTINNTVLTYTPYELEEGLKHGSEGKMPGVRALIDLLGPYPFPNTKEENKPEEKRGRGRPPKTSAESSSRENPTRKVINRAD